MTITVTGSTGTELVRLLSEAEAPVRAVLRDFTRDYKEHFSQPRG